MRLVLELWPVKAALSIVDLGIEYCRVVNPPMEVVFLTKSCYKSGIMMMKKLVFWMVPF